MIRRACEWITIRAKNTDIGATLNANHVISIRVQPEVGEIGNGSLGAPIEEGPTGRFLVLIDLVNSQCHSLTFDTQEEATIEYEHLTEDLRGETIQ